MQLLKQWSGSSRKRPADEIIQERENSRKRSKDDKTRQDSIGAGTATAVESDPEYRIRGTSQFNNKGVSQDQSASSPRATKPPRSPPLIHPDRRDNILNTAPMEAAPTPTSLINRNSPPSPSSQNPEHIDKGVPEEPRRK